ncbi:hypothetical protein BKA63DRAFT_570042 [Paraphoma chrysanthemicola]|nr:hypothetical protein BKA63DRAFT_570042 [Paraphoma chrysanthemicola]
MARTKTFSQKQVDEIADWATAQKILYKFDSLPLADAYTFAEISRTERQENNIFSTRLFLGQNQEFRSWAAIKLFANPRNPSAVSFRNVARNGKIELVTTMAELALMYPFRALKKKGTAESLRHLKVIIQYAFLDADIIPRLFPDGMKTAKDLLSAATFKGNRCGLDWTRSILESDLYGRPNQLIYKRAMDKGSQSNAYLSAR